jgi:hypothetical protein
VYRLLICFTLLLLLLLLLLVVWLTAVSLLPTTAGSPNAALHTDGAKGKALLHSPAPAAAKHRGGNG